MPQPTQRLDLSLRPNSSSPRWDSSWPDGDRPEEGPWKIAKAQQYGSKINMYPIYPRPTGEVGSNAPHLWAHTTMPYTIKPGVLGGCWPFRWSATSPTSNLSVGSELARAEIDGLILHSVDSNYQKYVWSGTKSGTQNFNLKCTDQLDNFVEFNFSVTVDDSKFIFVDSTALDDSGSGTISSPKKLFSSVWNATNAGKIIVLRAGTHILADPIDSVNVGFASNRPIAIIGYPGETVNVSMATHVFRDGSGAGNANDVLLRDLNFTNIRSTDANVNAILFTGAQNRVTLDNLSFSGLSSGTVGDNNQSAIAFLDGGSPHNNIYCIDCHLASDAEISIFVSFNTQKVLLERPTGYGITQVVSNGAGFFNIKDQSDFVTVRGASFSGSTAGAGVAKISNQNSPGSYEEHCWYNYVTDNGAGVYWNQQRFLSGGGPMFDYAGSLNVTNSYAFVAPAWPDSDEPVLVEGLAIYGEYGPFYDTGTDGMDTSSITNQTLTSSQIDSSGELTGTGTAYRLTKGFELWSSP